MMNLVMGAAEQNLATPIRGSVPQSSVAGQSPVVQNLVAVQNLAVVQNPVAVRILLQRWTAGIDAPTDLHSATID